MPRQEGSKNKPKNAQNLLEAVIAVYEKQGKKLSYNLEDIGELTEEQKVTIAEAIKTNPDLTVPGVFELAGEDETPNTDYVYECGKCHQKLDRELANCPHCGTTLGWN